MRRFLTYWLPPILWAVVILLVSTDAFPASNTRRCVERMASWFGRQLEPSTSRVVNHLVRKLAHLTEYGILGALAFRAIRSDRSRWNLRWASGAVALAIAVAMMDEFHQS